MSDLVFEVMRYGFTEEEARAIVEVGTQYEPFYPGATAAIVDVCTRFRAEATFARWREEKEKLNGFCS